MHHEKATRPRIGEQCGQIVSKDFVASETPEAYRVCVSQREVSSSLAMSRSGLGSGK